MLNRLNLTIKELLELLDTKYNKSKRQNWSITEGVYESKEIDGALDHFITVEVENTTMKKF